MNGKFRYMAAVCLSLLLVVPLATVRQQVAAAKVNLRFCWWGSAPRHAATLDAIKLYMKKNPNVHIEAEYMGYDGYYKKLLTQIAGGNAPDIIQLDKQWTAELVAQGDFFLNLNRFKSTLRTNTYNKALLKDYCWRRKKLFGVPTGISSATLLCNQDFFAKYQIPVKTMWTWDEIVAYGKKVHEKDSQAYLLSGDLDIINRLIVHPYVAQKTGETWIRDDYTLALNRKLLTEALRYVASLYSSGTMEPFGESSIFIGKTEQNVRWINGNIGMSLNLIPTISQMKSTTPPGRKFFVAALPMHERAKQSANPLGPSQLLAINKKTRNAEEAVKFLNWFVNGREAALILGTCRGIPASNSARKVLVEADQIDPLVAKALDFAEQKPGKVWGALTENTEISQINKDVIEKVIFKKITPQQGAVQIMKCYQAKLDELKKSQR
jgi:oligogalacturonide transport system substrate-binding protein